MAKHQRRVAEPAAIDQPILEQPEITDAETGALLRAFFNLADRWALNDAEARILLGRPALRTFARWKADEAELSRIPHDTRQRLSILMGIHKGLRHMFREAERGYEWMRKPNRAFGGQSALERLLAGEIVDLAAVRLYLDAERGGW
jgi:hypothetical protein